MTIYNCHMAVEKAVENYKTFSTGLWKTILLSRSYHNFPRFLIPCATCTGVHYIRREHIFLVLYMSRQGIPHENQHQIHDSIER